jgi:dimethylargininase
MSWLALTREVSPRIAECELTCLERRPIDLELARRQHAAYEETLRALGLRVERIAPAPEHPDSVFVEDTAVVLDELAVITRPGAPSRRGELAGGVGTCWWWDGACWSDARRAPTSTRSPSSLRS